jgi:hypothetical protein
MLRWALVSWPAPVSGTTPGPTSRMLPTRPVHVRAKNGKDVHFPIINIPITFPVTTCTEIPVPPADHNLILVDFTGLPIAIGQVRDYHVIIMPNFPY